MNTPGNETSILLQIRKKYEIVKSIPIEKEGDKITALFCFERLLLSSNSPEVLDFQYSCMEDISDWRLYLCCRAGFGKRKNTPESFILDKLKKETSPRLLADSIHILGILRSEHTLPLALKHLHDGDEYIREVCLYVIGWMGDENFISLLEKNIISDKTTKIKITAGSAMRQIFWRKPETKNMILYSLKKCYFHEQDLQVKARLIELLSTISGKNLGIKESKNDPDLLLGDLDKAINKTNKFLKSI